MAYDWERAEQRYYFVFFNIVFMRSKVGWSVNLALPIGSIMIKSNALDVITIRPLSGIGFYCFPRWPIQDGIEMWRYSWEKQWEPGTLTLKNLWVRKILPGCKYLSSKVRGRKDVRPEAREEEKAEGNGRFG